MRILMMLTAGRAERLGRPLGLDQVVEPYYLLHDAGTEVVIVSALGGHPPFHGARRRSARATAVLRRFQDDRRARDAISDTLEVAQICPEDFDGGICIAALEAREAPDDVSAVLGLITALLAAGKCVAVVPSDILPAYQRPLDGLLIIGDQARSPARAAKALLAALDPGGG
jgi:hypothetical protein